MTEIIPTKEEFDSLKSELNTLKSELELVKSEKPEIVEQIDQSELILGAILEKGVEVFNTWTQGTIETNKYEIDKKYNFAEKQLNANSKIINGQTWSRVIIIGLSLILTAVLAKTGNLNEGFLAIVAVIIGAALKDSILNVFKGSKKE